MNMKNWKRTIISTILLISAALFAGTGTVSAKTKTVKIDMTKAASLTKRPAVLSKAKKVRVKSSKPSVAKVKYKKTKKNRRIVITGKKPGTATVTVRCLKKNISKFQLSPHKLANVCIACNFGRFRLSLNNRYFA